MIAITHVPSPRITECELTHAERVPIDFAHAVEQHDAYCALLRRHGLDVVTLDVNRDHPDCVFVEDTAIVLDDVAVLTSPGAESRRAEPAGIAPALAKYLPLARIALPATIDGGDVLRVGRTLFVGRSSRTNDLGIAALRAIAEPRAYTVRPVRVTGCLHLKSACCALPDGRLLVNPAWIAMADLHGVEHVTVPAAEPDGANVLLLDDTVVVPAEHPLTAALVRSLGFAVETVEISEFAKAEGGVTCSSILISQSA
jgi:dimethylargininase